MAGPHIKSGDPPDGILQPPPDPVALDRVALALGHGVTDAWWRVAQTPVEDFEQKIGSTPPFATAGGEKFGPFGQSSDDWLCPLRHVDPFVQTVRVTGSGGQALAPPGAAIGKNLAAALGGETGAKAMTALAHELGRLKGTLCHLLNAAVCGPSSGLSRKQLRCDCRPVRVGALGCAPVNRCPNVRGLYAESPCQVNCGQPAEGGITMLHMPVRNRPGPLPPPPVRATFAA